MATRKGIRISEHYVVSTNTIFLFIYVICILKIKRSDITVFYIVFKTQRPFATVFLFRVPPNSSQRLQVRFYFYFLCKT